MKKAILMGTAMALALFALSPDFVSGRQDGQGAGSGTDGFAVALSPETAESGRPDPFAPLARRADVPALRIPSDERALMTRGQETGPPPDQPQIYLGGIVWSSRRPMAFINERLVGIGDHVSGWKVAEIRRDQVFVEKGARTKILKIQVSFFNRERGRGTSSE